MTALAHSLSLPGPRLVRAEILKHCGEPDLAAAG